MRDARHRQEQLRSSYSVHVLHWMFASLPHIFSSTSLLFSLQLNFLTDSLSFLDRHFSSTLYTITPTHTYLIQSLNNLLDIYLEPMKKQKFLSDPDMNSLFGNIQEIVCFQREFLSTIQESVRNEGKNLDEYEQASQFRGLLFSIGDTFLNYAEKFKLYSSFCASHSKAQKILHPGNEALNQELVDFLNARSRGQQALSLESYLIKPIQRILKYPLLLQQFKQLTDSGSDEHKHLEKALKGMERVAEHIN